ncbi:cation-transporting P-type ATPase, partial [Candidatus Uhrbacteria bacterium]|nr:cation-transporting P-type ATPase [Candidatus Uhrbacteria bacterium]
TGIMSLTHAGDLDSVQRLGTKRSAAPSKAFWDALVLCNDAELPSARAAEAGVKLGSSTEMALLRGADQAGISIKARRSRFSRIAEIPFDSHRKFMAVRVREEGGGRREGGEDIFYVKGAPEVLLPLLGSIDRNRREESLAKEEKETLTARAAEMADQGLRVLLLARRRVPSSDGLVTSSIRDLVFLGFVGLSDPLRKGIRERVLEARAAGVRSIIVTGDHPQTARAIAEEAGILSSKEDVVLLGSTLDKETDVEIRSSLEHVSVIARVEPHHKQKIVDLFQRSGRVVAMTGDGVNDAPALKAADIGIALGSGTAVAKETSDLVLLDNDFSTIIAAIEEGRLLFDNIRKTVTYLLFDTFTLIILMLGAFLLGLPLPLLPLQILWINLVTDSLPSMALAFEPREDDLLGRPPRRRNEPILNRTLLLYLFIVGIATDFILLVGYRALLGSGVMEGEARSVIFAGAAAGSLLTAYAIRALRKPFWRVRLGQNWWLTGAVWAGLIPIMAMLTIPGWGSWLGITVLPAFLLPIALAFSLVKPVCLELAKALVRSRKNDSV